MPEVQAPYVTRPICDLFYKPSEFERWQEKDGLRERIGKI